MKIRFAFLLGGSLSSLLLLVTNSCYRYRYGLVFILAKV